jgi:hypothetical protein
VGTTTKLSLISLINPQPASGAWNNTIVWDANNNKIVVSLIGDLAAGVVWSFAFKVRNGPLSQSAVSISLVQGVGTQVSPTQALGIDSLVFNRRYIEQSSPYPCDVNRITVTLQTNIDLLNTCGSASGVGDNVFPALTISGLQGSKFNTNTTKISSDSPAFNNSATNLTNGVLWFRPLTTVSKDVDYVISFNVRNQEVQNPAGSPTISADIVTNIAAAMETSSIDTSKVIYILNPVVSGVGTRVHQSSDNPVKT